jgi:exonuclease V gamma subunit
VIYSNSHHQLISALAQSIAADFKPFWRYVIIVPSESQRQYCLYYLAQIFGNTLAFDVVLGNQYLNISADLGISPVSTLGTQLANRGDFELILVQILSEILRSETIDPLLEVSPLLEMLRQSEGRQVWPLAQSLAKNFSEYSTRSSSVHKLDDSPWDWQSYLWQRVRQSMKSKKCYHEIFRELAENLNHSIQIPVSFHLLGFCEAPSAFLQWIKALSHHYSVQWYVLSASRLYWEDLDSFWRSQKLLYQASTQNTQSQFDTLEAMLLERNPLLANMCSVARPLALFLQDNQTQSFDAYILSSDVSTIASYQDYWWQEMRCENLPLTLLRALQTDLLLMRSGYHSEKLNLEFDTSLIIHQCPNQDVEVRAVHALILRLLKDDPLLKLHDILVLAPDIQRYRSSIDRLFYQSRQTLAYRIQDKRESLENGWLSSLESLLQFSLGDWNPTDYLEVLNLAPIHKRFDTRNACELLKRRLQAHPMAWGVDATHAAKIGRELSLDEESSHFEKNWQHFWQMFIESICLSRISCFLDEENSDDLEKNSSLWGSHAFAILSHLHQMFLQLLEPWYRAHMASLSEWSAKIRILCHELFASGDLEEAEHLENVLAAFEGADEGYSIDARTFSLLLFDRLKREKSSWPKLNDSVLCFASLELMRSIPAKHILLIGLGDGFFGKPDPICHWKWQKDIGIEASTSLMQIARYSFLETILSAKNSLHFFFSSNALEPAHPSLILSELIAYLDEAFEVDQSRFSDKQKVIHMIDETDPSYQLRPLSDLRCRLKASPTFLPSFQSLSSEYLDQSLGLATDQLLEKKINIQHAHLLYCDPLRYYYTYHLQCERPFFRASLDSKVSLQASYFQSREWLKLAKKKLNPEHLEKAIEKQSASYCLSDLWTQKISELQLLQDHYFKLPQQQMSHCIASEGLALFSSENDKEKIDQSSSSLLINGWSLYGSLDEIDLVNPQIWVREPLLRSRQDLARQLPIMVMAYQLGILKTSCITLVPMHSRSSCRILDLSLIDTHQWLCKLVKSAEFCQQQPLIFSSDLHCFLFEKQSTKYHQALIQKKEVEEKTSSLIMPLHLYGLDFLYEEKELSALLEKHLNLAHEYLQGLWKPIWDLYSINQESHEL